MKREELTISQAIDEIGEIHNRFYAHFGRYPNGIERIYIIDYVFDKYIIKIGDYNAKETTLTKKTL